MIGDGWRFRGRARLSVDYGGVHGLAADRWQQENPDEIGKTILEEQGYYYGWGGSARLDVELSSPRFGLGARAFYGYYSSAEGLDRFQDMITVDQQVSDRVGEYQLWLRSAIYGPAFVEIRTNGVRRSETFEELTASARLSRYAIGFGAHFQ